MLLGEAGAARVRGVVYEDCLGVGLDLGLKVFEVDLPFLFGDQVVVVELNAKILANWLAQGKTRSSDQDTVTTVTQNSHGIINGTRATKGEEHVVRIDGVLFSSKLFGNCLTSRCCTRGLSIAISNFRVDGFDNSLANLRIKHVSVGFARLTETQVDHRKGVISWWLHLSFEDNADRVEDFSACSGFVLFGGPGI